MIKDLGEAILYSCESIPNGIIVIFASHGLMQSCSERWSTDGLLDKLREHKGILYFFSINFP